MNRSRLIISLAAAALIVAAFAWSNLLPKTGTVESVSALPLIRSNALPLATRGSLLFYWDKGVSRLYVKGVVEEKSLRAMASAMQTDVYHERQPFSYSGVNVPPEFKPANGEDIYFVNGRLVQEGRQCQIYYRPLDASFGVAYIHILN